MPASVLFRATTFEFGMLAREAYNVERSGSETARLLALLQVASIVVYSYKVCNL